MLRQCALATALFAAAAIVPHGARAESADSFPSRPITVVVPFAPGTTADLLFRGLGEIASKELGQAVVIENRVGGQATLGPANMAANAKPDGYTIAQIPITVFRVPVMQKATFDPVKDFTYIIMVAGYSLGAVVKADGPFKKWQDVIDYAKANPGKFSYTTVGRSSTNSIAMELMSEQSGVKFTHVPGKGGGEGLSAVLGGHVSALVESPSWAPLVDSGELRLLVMLGSQRSKKWPDAPILRELGYTYEFDSPFGLAGPKGMDPAIVKKLHDAFKKAYDDASIPPLYDKFDFTRRYLNTADYQAFVPKFAASEREALTKLGLAKKE